MTTQFTPAQLKRKAFRTRWAGWVLLTMLGCTTATAPDSVAGPDVTFRTVHEEAYHLEDLLPPTVTTAPGRIVVGLSEWFPEAGYTLTVVSRRFRPIPPPPDQGAPGLLALTVESRPGYWGLGIVWRKDSEISITALPPGHYNLRIMRYDPDILPSIHPFGNPRLPVDTIVTVP